MKKKLNIENNFVIGHVGRFDVQKNHNSIIDILFSITKVREDAVLLLVGDGPLKEEIEKKVDELGLSENVMFLGVQPDIAALLSSMDVFLFPSLYEGLPVTLIEAQANGLPCVVSDTVTSESKITDCVNFFPLNEPSEKWAEKVVESAKKEHCPNTYSSIASAGYDIESNAHWLESFYLKAAHEKEKKE
ncbi:glycosyltransferase [Halomonas piscis]|uniref:Glycosyltransferase n=1 Tax=Halomonas piscis TaxID=3031727 RepID=A0ABY9YZ50_9GAMM|nr:glycosyltransferase [Halomonas piscis]WNK20148.1 glycosyltransferase [Halomonas piscis]